MQNLYFHNAVGKNLYFGHKICILYPFNLYFARIGLAPLGLVWGLVECGLVWWGLMWGGLVWWGLVFSDGMWWVGVVWSYMVWWGLVGCGRVWWGVVGCGVLV